MFPYQIPRKAFFLLLSVDQNKNFEGLSGENNMYLGWKEDAL